MQEMRVLNVRQVKRLNQSQFHYTQKCIDIHTELFILFIFNATLISDICNKKKLLIIRNTQTTRVCIIVFLIKCDKFLLCF